MAYKSVHNGIIFIEGEEQFTKKLGPVEFTRDKIYNSQLRDLDNVKEQLSMKAKQMGGNAVINFKYGQKSVHWFKSLLLAADDNVKWFGSGEVVLLSKETYDDIVSKLENK